jgi:hypothetical protein
VSHKHRRTITLTRTTITTTHIRTLPIRSAP